jgi:hypothetical protein
MPRHGRLADVLVEQAALFETTDPMKAGVLAMTALVFYAPRWEIYLRTTTWHRRSFFDTPRRAIWPKANSMHTPS